MCLRIVARRRRGALVWVHGGMVALLGCAGILSLLVVPVLDDSTWQLKRHVVASTF